MKAATKWDEGSGQRRSGDESFSFFENISATPDATSSAVTCASPFAFGCARGSIEIPFSLRSLPIEQLPVSARLSGVLERSKVRVLGDLHGRSFDEFAQQRNCGLKTLRELEAALCLAQHTGAAILSQVAASAAASCTFLVPESVRDLKFADLPSSTRLEGLVRKNGMHELGDLHGRNAAELLRCSNIGIGTIVEIQRLIGRAGNGEFKGIAVEPSAAPAALLSLLEAALFALSSRDRELLLDRIGARGTDPATFEQLGRDYRVTRERARQIIQESVAKLKKTWGPRIPHLLEMVKGRCVAMLSPLSPELLENWMKGFHARLRLAARTHIQLIGALDPEFPCWPGGRVLMAGAVDLHVEFIRTLLLARTPGGVGMSDAYRVLTAQKDLPALSFAVFVHLLGRMPNLVVRFDQPENALLQLRQPNDNGGQASHLSPLRPLPAYDRSSSPPAQTFDRAIQPAA